MRKNGLKPIIEILTASNISFQYSTLRNNQFKIKKEKNKVKGLKDLENMVSEKKIFLKKLRKNQNTGINIIIFATEEGVK